MAQIDTATPKATIRGYVVALLTLGSFCFPLIGQTATSPARTEIFGAATITWVDDLFFGVIPSPAAAGTVIVQTSGVNDDPSWTRGGTLPVIGGTVQPARFSVNTSKSKGNRFWIELPSSISISEPGGATMVVDQFNANVNGPCLTSTNPGKATVRDQCPQATPNYDLVVGGRLNVSPNQSLGIYTGTFVVVAHTN